MKHPTLLLLTLAYALNACTAALPPPITASPATPVSTAVPATSPTASPSVAPATAPAPSPTTAPRYLGSLSPQQREVLAAAAQAYVSPTPAEALATAQRLDYIGRNANPATMCGPLALAILQDAGMVDPAIRLIDFWYLDPRPSHDEKFLQTVFPPEHFEKIEQELPLNQVDYAANPLYPGDFLYLFAGDSGSFEHMLVVSRVDDAGRAYAVTNLNTADGVVVREVLLYDPAQPGVGQFYEWTDWENRLIGRTGYGGFWLWRLAVPLNIMESSALQLGNEITQIIDETGGDWIVLLKEVNGPIYYSRQAYKRIHPASVIKLADAVLFLILIESKEIGDLAEYLSTYGTEGRSYEQLLRAMIVNSEEEATASIERYLADTDDPNKMLQDLGFTFTTITPRQSNAADMSRMLERLYTGTLLSPETTEYLLDLLATPSDSDNVRTGIIRSYLTGSDRLFNKRGSLADDRVIVADLALLEIGEKAYIMAFFAYPSAEQTAGYEALEEGTEQITLVFWNYLSEK